MSDSLEVPPPVDPAPAVGGIPIATPIPRRMMRARRDAAEALGLASVSSLPAWSVAPAAGYGSAVPLDVDAFGETSSR